MDSLEVTTTGLLLGLATGPACLLSCAPVLMPLMLTRSGPGSVGRTVLRLMASFLSGRLVAYVLVGLASGLLGSSLKSLGSRVPYWATLILAILLLIQGLAPAIPYAGCTHFGRLTERKGFPFVLGMLAGLNLCPPFLMAVSWTMQQGMGPTSGILFFVAFFLATSLYVLPVGFGGYWAGRRALVSIGRGAALLAGAFFLLQCLAHPP
jgi:sulfite exporter TauE/SafE